MLEGLLFTLLFLLGLVAMFVRPLSRFRKISNAWEVGFGVLAMIVCFFYLTENYFLVSEIEKDLAKRPCGDESPQGACYSLDKQLCEKAWETSEGPCHAEMAPVIRERPGALLGPAINLCKARRMDQVFHFNRANTNTAYCKAYFKYLEENH